MRTHQFMRRVVMLGATVLAAGTPAVGLRAQAQSDLLLIVLNNDKGGAMLGFVDVAAGKIVERVPIGHDPHIVRMSPDGKLAVVNNRNGFAKRIPERDSIHLIDVPARKEIRRVEVGDGARPHDTQIAGDKVYFTAVGFKALGRYDMARNKIEFFGGGQSGPTQIVVSKDGNTIVGVNPGTDNVSVFQNVLAGPVGQLPSDRTLVGNVTSFTHWTHTLIPVGNGPSGIAMSPDGTEVWTANEEEGGGISIVNLAKKTAVTVDLQTRHVVRLRFTQDGRRLLLLDREPGEVTFVDVPTRKVLKRIRFTADTPGLQLSTGNLAIDAGYAYITVAPEKGGTERDYYIAIIDLKTMEISKRIQTNTYANGITCARCS